ncbi:hypothetical protein HNY73_020560 [Argiope bruennichi]|uniref:Uncharacterized protein n=1 Tax=Argiope bruennichi TaxID=94029 RepID=A0A8T0E817_ARGBR|nr:hypothetical protein HNY73_020560 [Argiope bruennichi]
MKAKKSPSIKRSSLSQKQFIMQSIQAMPIPISINQVKELASHAHAVAESRRIISCLYPSNDCILPMKKSRCYQVTLCPVLSGNTRSFHRFRRQSKTAQFRTFVYRNRLYDIKNCSFLI